MNDYLSKFLNHFLYILKKSSNRGYSFIILVKVSFRKKILRQNFIVVNKRHPT